jgi:hypothetical protein
MPMPRAGALAALAATMTVGCGVAATTASTARATPPRGGTIEFYTSGTLATPIRAYVITGAFADSGATSPKDNPANGLVFTKGSIRINNSAANAAESRIYAHLGRYVNASTCALTYHYTAPIELLSGTGAYAGITGSVTLHNTDVGVLPRTQAGTCNESPNVTPIGFLSESHGSGRASFK